MFSQAKHGNFGSSLDCCITSCLSLIGAYLRSLFLNYYIFLKCYFKNVLTLFCLCGIFISNRHINYEKERNGMRAFMIGAGDIAKSHARAVERLGGEIVGAYDISEEALRSFTREFYCEAVSYDKIGEYVELADYAVISTPPTRRLDYIETVLSRHIPLYLEKPISVTLEDQEKIVEMAKKYDARIIVGFAHRFRPAFVKMHELVKSGMFGEPVNVFSYRVGSGWGFGGGNAIYSGSWRTDPKYACGMTIESVSHEFNLLTALAGEFESISCNVKATMENVPKFDTNSTMIMRCRCGAVASIMTSWSSGVGANIKGYIGTKGSIILEGRNMFEFDSLTYRTVDMPQETRINFNDSYDLNKDEVIYNIHKYFQDCLKNDRPIEIGSLAEGVKVLRLSNAALEASREQKTVVLGEYWTI